MSTGITPSRTPKEQYGNISDQAISFEQTNVYGINPHDGLVKIKNIMEILANMEAGIYGFVETQWSTTNPSLRKFIKDIIKNEDKYATITIGSNQDNFFKNIMEA